MAIFRYLIFPIITQDCFILRHICDIQRSEKNGREKPKETVQFKYPRNHK